MTASLPLPENTPPDAGREGAPSPDASAPSEDSAAEAPAAARTPARKSATSTKTPPARTTSATGEKAAAVKKTAPRKTATKSATAKSAASTAAAATTATASTDTETAAETTSPQAAARTAAGKTTAGKTTAGKTTASRKPAAKKPAGSRTTTAKKPAAKRPAASSAANASGPSDSVSAPLTPGPPPPLPVDLVIPPLPPLPPIPPAGTDAAAPADDADATAEPAPAAEDTRADSAAEPLVEPARVAEEEPVQEPDPVVTTMDPVIEGEAGADAESETTAPAPGPDAVAPEPVLVEPEERADSEPDRGTEPAAVAEVEAEAADADVEPGSAAEVPPAAVVFADDGELDTSGSEVPALALSGVTKSFGSTLAVAGVDLTVPAGSFYGIVGPNGAGKTTTLSMIAGLLRSDSGSIAVNGVDVRTDPSRAKRAMGVLPDRLRTFDRLTGRQLLYYYGVLRGLSSAVVESRINDLARAFDLVDALGRPVSDYSAGMTKKVMLAGAMIHSPRLLVLDEPFESVDPVSSAVILDILGTYVQHGGTVILSSHGMELVERVCTRVAVLVAGQVLAEGTVDEVRGAGTLQERFVELAGGLGDVEGLEWLHTFSD